MKPITPNSVHAHVQSNTITIFVLKDNETLHIANTAIKSSLGLLQSIATTFVKGPWSKQNSLNDGLQETKQESADNMKFPNILNAICLTNITTNVANAVGLR